MKMGEGSFRGVMNECNATRTHDLWGQLEFGWPMGASARRVNCTCLTRLVLRAAWKFRTLPACVGRFSRAGVVSLEPVPSSPCLRTKKFGGVSSLSCMACWFQGHYLVRANCSENSSGVGHCCKTQMQYPTQMTIMQNRARRTPSKLI